METPEPSMSLWQRNVCDKQGKNRTEFIFASPEPAKHSSNKFPITIPANNP